MHALLAPLPWGLSTHLHRGLQRAFPAATPAHLVAAEGSFDACVAAVEAERRALGAERVVVAGHSMATLVALAYALRFPAHVAGLVLIGGASGPKDLRAGIWRPGHPKHAAWLKAYQDLRAGGDPRDYVVRLLELSFARPEDFALLQPDLAELRVDKARMDAFFEGELPRLDLAPRLPDIAAPALVVGGREDALCVPEATARQAEALPRARLVVLDGCGHFPWYEQPVAFAAALQAFLASLPANGRGGK